MKRENVRRQFKESKQCCILVLQVDTALAEGGGGGGILAGGLDPMVLLPMYMALFLLLTLDIGGSGGAIGTSL